MYKVSLQELKMAAQLIRSNPDLTREQFYQTVTAANPAGLSQNEIETAIQTVTSALVDLNFVESNNYDSIAPWVRGLPAAQVDLLLSAIHKKYLENLAPLLKQETIDLLNVAWAKAKRQYDKMRVLTNEDPEILEGLQSATQFFKATADTIEQKLIKLGALPEPDELVEVE